MEIGDKTFKHNHRVIFYPFVFILCYYVTIILDIYHNVWDACGKLFGYTSLKGALGEILKCSPF